MIEVLSGFIPTFFAGFLVNLEIAAGALALGLAAGLPICHRSPPLIL